MPRDHELEAAVTCDRQSQDIKHRAHVAIVRADLDGVTGYPWHAVDLRHQRNGQIRIFAGRGTGGGIIANVLRSGSNAARDAKVIAGAPDYLSYLLAELDRVDVTGPAGVRLAAAVLHAAGPLEDRHAPLYLPDTCHICAAAAGLVNQAKSTYGTFTEE